MTPATDISMADASVASDPRLEDLAQIISAYNQVTDKLQQSHEVLNNEVLRLRQELASADAQLQRSKRLAALGEMAAGIAHEIRNPLAAIHLYARMITEDLELASPNTLLAGENAGKIADAVRGLNSIVNDVLHFARELRLRPCSIEIKRLVERAIEAHRPAIEQAKVRIVTRCDDLILEADADLMHQAILNLIRNAVDAMAEHTGSRELVIEAVQEDDAIRITVADTGPGIAEADVDRLFNPFFTTRNTGTGLGLAIVHRILDAHGGEIAVHNEAGAVFTLTLPATVAVIHTDAEFANEPVAGVHA